jgi:hypothetical protein
MMTRTKFAGIVIAGFLALAALVTWWYVGTVTGRLMQLAHGILGLALVAMAAALWTRSSKYRWLKRLPIKWLQKNHVLLGMLTIPLTVCHVGRVPWPASPLTVALLATYAVLLWSGVRILFFKRLRSIAKFVEDNDPGKATTAANRRPPTQDALAASQLITAAPEKQLQIHRTVTLGFLAFLIWHVIHHLYY